FVFLQIDVVGDRRFLCSRIPEDDPTRAAVSLFWTKRADQMAALADGGKAGGAARAAGHMSGIRDLVASIFIDAG
ncbi:hypothetical protein, partial [Mycobacterium avium]|uniref:hypothetical protein n=1 Tax=Mycobacterium avium TaxID=1764 RepID=UPI000A3E1C87